MKQLEEYRKKELVVKLADRIAQRSSQPVTLMEVCGGHTLTLHKYGLLSLLPSNITLISGPGCPVCVSGQGFIHALLNLVSDPSVMLASYGDLLRIPSRSRSLETARASGADIRVVYSVMEALALAMEHPKKNVVFAGIGFETTAPLSAAVILQAKEKGLKNFFVYSAHKIMPPALSWICSNTDVISGFIAPGHVTAITGTAMYEGLVSKYHVGVVVSGFEPLDMMLAVSMLTDQAETGHYCVENAYRRAVRREGNTRAKQIMAEVFETADANWRGLGVIPGSGLQIRPAYGMYDARRVFRIHEPALPEPEGCLCGRIITGRATPAQCRHFGKTCTPETPVGACMVSHEGACSIWYQFKTPSRL